MGKVSEMDERHLEKIRTNVSQFIQACAKKYDKKDTILLDIAPQVHEGAAPHFKLSKIKTLDIDSDSGADYIADLCQKNDTVIPNDYFDYVVCTEVLEHTLQPFDAVKEMYRILKPGGSAFVSVPFNFRIHGPLPDCWRFTEYGLRELFKDFKILKIRSLETKNRFLMPSHYTLIAKKE